MCLYVLDVSLHLSAGDVGFKRHGAELLLIRYVFLETFIRREICLVL